MGKPSMAVRTLLSVCCAGVRKPSAFIMSFHSFAPPVFCTIELSE